MKRKFIHAIVSVLLSGIIWPAFSTPQRKLSNISLSILDSFGNPQNDCRVTEFALRDDGINSDLAGKDYREHFRGSIQGQILGREIPFALRYGVTITCGRPGVSQSFFVAVNRPDQDLVLAFWPHAGDYVTGPSPRLTISVIWNSQPIPNTWIKVVGVYLEDQEAAKLQSETQAATFFELVPGRYLVLLLQGNNLICTKPVDLLEAHAQIKLSASSASCTAEGDSRIKIL